MVYYAPHIAYCARTNSYPKPGDGAERENGYFNCGIIVKRVDGQGGVYTRTIYFQEQYRTSETDSIFFAGRQLDKKRLILV